MASALEQEVTTRCVEYERLVELGVFAGERLELLDGVLVVREPQGSPHAAIVAKVGYVVAAAFRGAWHLRLHSPLALGEHSEPEPDVAVVAGKPDDYLDARPSTAVLVVEVADSSLRLDRRFKAAVYARAGLREYWIVNLVDRVLEVHRQPQPAVDAAEGWIYRSVDVLRPPATVTPLAAPGARIPIAAPFSPDHRHPRLTGLLRMPAASGTRRHPLGSGNAEVACAILIVVRLLRLQRPVGRRRRRAG